MASFKLTCSIETDEKGKHEVDLYVKDVATAQEAERAIKHHFCIDKPEVAFYGVTKCTEI